MSESPRFIINGKEYGNMEEVPEEFRADLQGAEKSEANSPPVSVEKPVRFKVNGKEYRSADEMPAEIRKLFEDENANSLPDVMEGVAPRELLSHAPCEGPAVASGTFNTRLVVVFLAVVFGACLFLYFLPR
jgi:hypothetical protein